jgi:hypothetical protein
MSPSSLGTCLLVGADPPSVADAIAFSIEPN